MSVSHSDREVLNQSYAYSGEARGHRFTCAAARYAAGRMVLRVEQEKSDGWKGAGARLAETLGGRWTHRDNGYQLTPERSRLWRALFVAGWDTGYWIAVKQARPMLRSPDGRNLTIAEATREVMPKTAA